MIRLLLARDDIEVNKPLALNGVTPLYIACARGQVEVIALLLAWEGIDVNKAKTDQHGSKGSKGGGITPLYIACQEGNVDAARLLLARDDIDVNQASDNSVCCDVIRVWCS